MKPTFRLYRRGEFTTASTTTRASRKAWRRPTSNWPSGCFHAKNEAPILVGSNLLVARAYMSVTDPHIPRCSPAGPSQDRCSPTVKEKDRATEFKQRCEGLGITGITCYSYRYGWAERAAVVSGAPCPNQFGERLQSSGPRRCQAGEGEDGGAGGLRKAAAEFRGQGHSLSSRLGC